MCVALELYVLPQAKLPKPADWPHIEDAHEALYRDHIAALRNTSIGEVSNGLTRIFDRSSLAGGA